MNVEIAKELSAKLGIKILSTHLSPGYDPQADLADCPSVEVAQEGKEYEI